MKEEYSLLWRPYLILITLSIWTTSEASAYSSVKAFGSLPALLTEAREVATLEAPPSQKQRQAAAARRLLQLDESERGRTTILALKGWTEDDAKDSALEDGRGESDNGLSKVLHNMFANVLTSRRMLVGGGRHWLRAVVGKRIPGHHRPIQGRMPGHHPANRGHHALRVRRSVAQTTVPLQSAAVDYCANHVLLGNIGDYGLPVCSGGECWRGGVASPVLNRQLTIRMDINCGSRFRTPGRFSHGTFSALIKTASGDTSGLVTSFYLSSKEGVPGQMEIDFEFLGKHPRSIQTNYYVNGKGGNEILHNLNFNPNEAFHRYEIQFEVDRIVWRIDNLVVRQVIRDGRRPFPTGPVYLYASVWNAQFVLGGGWAGRPTWANSPYLTTYREIQVPHPALAAA